MEPISRGTGSSNPSPSSGESATNCTAVGFGGTLTVWCTEAAIAAWKAEPRCTRGGGVGYRERRVEMEPGVPSLFAVNLLAPYILTALIKRPKRLVI